MTISPAISERDHVAFGCDDSVRFALDQHSLLDRHVAPFVHIILNPSHLDLKTLTVDEMICCNTCHTNSWGISSQIYRFLFLSYTCHTNSWGISCQIYRFLFLSYTCHTHSWGISCQIYRFLFLSYTCHTNSWCISCQIYRFLFLSYTCHTNSWSISCQIYRFLFLSYTCHTHSWGHQLSDLPLSIQFWVLPFAISNIHLVFLLLYVSLRSEFRVVMSVAIST